MAAAELSSWRDGPAKQAIVDFVARVCGHDGSEPVPVEDRLAVFDNDGTLWCEKPMPIQLDFILRRLVEMAEADPALRDRQPWKAAYERDYGWLGALMTEHYAGNDANVKVLAGGILAAYDGSRHPDAALHSARRQADPPALVLHDDGEREFAYTSGADKALERAAAEGWTVVSVKDDWASVF